MRKTTRLTLGLALSAALAERAERGVGATVRQEAKDFKPFGQVVSAFATTCGFPT